MGKHTVGTLDVRVEALAVRVDDLTRRTEKLEARFDLWGTRAVWLAGSFILSLMGALITLVLKLR